MTAPRSDDKDLRLPGMELLGFYDQPYQVRVDQPRRPQRPAAPVRKPAPVLQHTARVAHLWETTELDDSLLDWWRPEVIRRRKLGGRNFRHATLATWILAAFLVLGGILFVLDRPTRLAEETGLALGTSTTELMAALPALIDQTTALGQTEPPDLAASTTAVLDVEGPAREVFALAGDLAEENEAAREKAVASASTILDVTTRVNRLVAYRLTAETALVTPDLPSVPESDDLASVTEQVANWRGSAETAIDDLSPDVLPTHHDQMQVWRDGFQDWQTAYLDALRQGDPMGMGAALDRHGQEIAELRRLLLAALGSAGDDMTNALTHVETDLGALLRR